MKDLVDSKGKIREFSSTTKIILESNDKKIVEEHYHNGAKITIITDLEKPKEYKLII